MVRCRHRPYLEKHRMYLTSFQALLSNEFVCFPFCPFSFSSKGWLVSKHYQSVQKYYVHAKTLLSVVEVCHQLYFKQLLWYHLSFVYSRLPWTRMSLGKKDLGRGENIGRKGSENNIWLEAFSKKKKMNHAQSFQCNKRNLVSLPKRFVIAMTGNRRKRGGIQKILRIKKKKSLQILK